MKPTILLICVSVMAAGLAQAQWVNDRCTPECDSVQYEPADPFDQQPARFYVSVRLPNPAACPVAALSLNFIVVPGDSFQPTMFAIVSNDTWIWLTGVVFLVDGERIALPLKDPVRKVLAVTNETKEEAGSIISRRLLRRLAAASIVQVRFQGRQSCDTTLPDAAKPALARLAAGAAR